MHKPQVRLLSLLVMVLVDLWGCATTPPKLMTMQDPPIHIYVVSHGWHVGIVVRRDDIPDHLWPDHRELPAAAYLEIGWGDKDFYQAEKATLGLILKAALQPTPSVLHLVWFDLPADQYFSTSEIIEVGLTHQGFEALCRFIHHTYQRDAQGKPLPLGPGLYGTSAFYLAQGRYHLFNTCNTWTAKALRAAGCPIAPARALTAGSVMARTRKFGRLLREPSAHQTYENDSVLSVVCAQVNDQPTPKLSRSRD